MNSIVTLCHYHDPTIIATFRIPILRVGYNCRGSRLLIPTVQFAVCCRWARFWEIRQGLLVLFRAGVLRLFRVVFDFATAGMETLPSDAKEGMTSPMLVLIEKNLAGLTDTSNEFEL